MNTVIKTNTATKDDFRRPKNATWLQGCGWTYGKPAGELRVGDIMAWNGGATSTVVKIANETNKFVTIIEEWEDEFCGGKKQGERRLKKDRIVATAEAK